VDTQGGSSAVRDVASLSGRAWWLVRLRWLAVIVVFGIVTVASRLLHVELRVRELYLIGALLALANLVFFAVGKVSQIAQDKIGRRARVFANAQISTDLIALAALIHYSGGVENPFVFYFIFHIIVSGTLLSPLEASLQALLAIVLFCGMAVLERAGLIAHYHVPGLATPDLYRNSLYIMGTIAAFASTMCLAVFTAISITSLVRVKQKESADLIAQLQQAYRQLGDVERSKSQYMRRVSHELRAPLGAIQNLLSMLENALTGEGRSNEREFAARASKRIDQALKLVSDLLILARSQDAKFTVKMREISLDQAINEAVGALRPRAEGKGLTLTLDVPRDLPPVWGDAESLEQLFTNLTANAIKYTAGGGQVTICASSQDDRVLIRVSDTGIGIPSEELPYVFDEFFRGKTARQFAEQGTGLGLSIVRSIADLLGADVRVQSEVGEGTIFELTMPSANARSPGSEAA